MSALASGVPYWLASDPGQAVAQCEVLSEVEQITLDISSLGQAEGAIKVGRTRYQYVMVMSQDCDVLWDHVAREDLEKAGEPPAIGSARKAWNETTFDARTKIMDGVIVCVAEEEEAVHDASGLHSKQWQFAKSNQHERYHRLRPCAPDQDLEGIGFPALVLDFKRYFTIPPLELRVRAGLASGVPGRAIRRAALTHPYLEHAAARFYRFQARVALPDEDRG